MCYVDVLLYGMLFEYFVTLSQFSFSTPIYHLLFRELF